MDALMVAVMVVSFVVGIVIGEYIGKHSKPELEVIDLDCKTARDFEELRDE